MTQPAEYSCLAGKTALLTGAAGAIGQAILRMLHRQGTKVYALDRNTRLQALIEDEFAADPVQPVPVACDLLEIDDLKATIQSIGNTAGQIDFVINCAGDDTRQDWLKVDQDAWELSQDLNLRHVFFVTQSAFEFMGNEGAVVNLGSKNAVTKKGGVVGYATAKAGIMGLTGSLAREVGEQGIRVNCVMPGLVETERNYQKWITPESELRVLERQCLKSVCQPDDVANLVVFLCSSQSRMISGQTIAIDGGS